MRPFYLVCFLLLAAVPTLSQTTLPRLRLSDSYTQGSLPITQTASLDNAWSIFSNPGGMGFVGGAQLVVGYQGEWDFLINSFQKHYTQAAFVTQVFSGLSLGVGGSFSAPGPQNASTGTGSLAGTFAASFRFGNTASLGLSAFKLRELEKPEANPFLFSLGAQGRVTHWLALGGAIE
jgi:hypothetical protein